MPESHINYLYNYKTIKEEIINIKKDTNLLVVTKNQNFDKIKELISIGHCDFAENRVQAANEKWSEVLKLNKNIQLHLIGKLQSNKAKDAFLLFNFIHTLDNEKLANKFHEIEKNSQKKIECLQDNMQQKAKGDGGIAAQKRRDAPLTDTDRTRKNSSTPVASDTDAGVGTMKD